MNCNGVGDGSGELMMTMIYQDGMILRTTCKATVNLGRS